MAGSLSVSSPDAAAWQGIQAVARDPAGCVRGVLRSVTPGTDVEPSIRKLRDDQVTVLMTADLALADRIAAVAASYPELRFAIIDAVVPRSAENLITLDFRHDQAAYLAGSLAGLMTRTNVVGGVYGLDIASIHEYRVGFENGVKAVNPTIAADPAHRLLGVYQAPGFLPFADPDWGRSQAEAMLTRGADIIFGAGGSTGTGALLGAVAAHRWCIGAEVDQYLQDPAADPCLLTSAVTDIARAVQHVVADEARGRWPAGPRVTFGLATGGVGLAPFHANDGEVSAAVRARLAEIEATLKDGRLATGA